MKEFCMKVILPLAAIGLLVLVFLPICKTEGKTDFFLLWLLVGCPFGIRRMFLWLVPSGYGIAGTVGVVALNFIAGGLIGGCVAVYKLIYAAFYILKTAGMLITGRT